VPAQNAMSCHRGESMGRVATGYIPVMLCYVMLCYVMLCYVMLCCVLSCYVM
jgi:hypothetical protein